MGIRYCFAVVACCILPLVLVNFVSSGRVLTREPAFRATFQVGVTSTAECAATTSHNGTLLIYNRLGKCGSTTTFDVLKSLAKQNQFQLQFSNKYYAKPEQFSRDPFFLRSLEASRSGHNALYINHIYFWGENLSHEGDFNNELLPTPTPMYMQIVREPIARLLSQFYFLTNPGLGKYYRQNRRRLQTEAGWENPTRDINECLSLAANPQYCEQTNQMTHYFCGHAPECSNPSSEVAFASAVHNFYHHYVFVGVLEHLHDTFAMLELLLPSFFRNATSMNIPHSNSAGKSSATYGNITQENVEKLRQWNANDIRLFDIILETFHQRTDACLRQTPAVSSA